MMVKVTTINNKIISKLILFITLVMNDECGTLATLQDQLINVKTKLSDQETTIKQAEIRYSLT